MCFSVVLCADFLSEKLIKGQKRRRKKEEERKESRESVPRDDEVMKKMKNK